MSDQKPEQLVLASWPCVVAGCTGTTEVRECWPRGENPSTPFVALCDTCGRWYHKVDTVNREKGRVA